MIFFHVDKRLLAMEAFGLASAPEPSGDNMRPAKGDLMILHHFLLGVLFVFPLLPAFSQAPTAGPLAPTGLTCEYMVDPLGIDSPQPRLSWTLSHMERSQGQNAYQLLVSTSPGADAGDQWDTGKVSSEQSAFVRYAGPALKSRTSYFWKVRYWDRNGRPGPYSAVARFETAFLPGTSMGGEWIGGANQLRKELTLPSAPRRARAYVSGVGYYELRINGHKVGLNVLDPAWTKYDKRVLYTTNDVTSYLHPGANAAGVMLGQGWYKARALRFEMHVECETGPPVTVTSDGSWRVKAGPIIEDSVYDGESYDARLETPGWDQPNYNAAGWQPATLGGGPKGVLSAQVMPPIRVVDTMMPVLIGNPVPGIYIYDVGQNLSGWARLRVRGPRGTAVRIRFSELLYENGRLNVENLRTAKVTDTYVLSGRGDEVWEPRFTYHGFRYIELSGLPAAPAADTVRVRVVHSAVPVTGGFAASKNALNQLQRIVVWGQKTNLHSVPTDCAQRDERKGWMGDAHVTAEEALMNFDMGAFYNNFLRVIRDEQDEKGMIPDTVPHSGGRRPADPAWGAAFPLIAWYMYQYYGDRQVLEDNYDGIKRWVDYLCTRAQDGIIDYSYYGDWVAIEKTSGPLVSTFYHAYGADILSRMAGVLGKAEDQAKYGKLAADVKAAFHRKFFSEAAGSYAEGSQAANTLALYLDAVPQERRGSVMGALVNDIVYGHDTHVTTGFIAVKYLIELLALNGRPDLVYELATQSSYPSWGYMIANGATTVWELWQNKTGPSMNSHNHPMLGSVGAALYETFAGIRRGAKDPGYRSIRIAPQVSRDLRWASGSIETARGRIATKWSWDESVFRLEVEIPVGSEAEIELPKLNLPSITVREGDRVVWQNGVYQSGCPGLSAGRDTRGAVILQAGSGRYAFELSSR
jgi:alpha-L-rhamnosidase